MTEEKNKRTKTAFFYKYYTYKSKRNQCKHLLYKIKKYRDNSCQDRHNIIEYNDIWKYLIITNKIRYFGTVSHMGRKLENDNFGPVSECL